MNKSMAVSLIFGLSVSGVMAACPSSDQVVFSCITNKAKLIEVCDLGQQVTYSFGPVGKPELALRVPRAQASTQQWEGIGQTVSYSVDIPNGKTTYSVFWAVDRMDESAGVNAGVQVIINGKTAATVMCDSKKDITQNMEGIKLKPTP